MTTLKGDPWLRYRNTTLFAIPSVHNRIVFAQLVAEAYRRKRFDVVAVELPGSLTPEWLDRIAQFGSNPGLLVDGYGDSALVQVVETSGGRPVEVRARTGVITPITPADSIITAIRCPHMLASVWGDWRPQVVALDLDYVPAARRRLRLGPVDDYEVIVHGLQAFHHRWRHVWDRARSLEVDELRERAMAAQLRRLLDEGREVLFVCGAAHWSAITRLLDAGDCGSGTPTRPTIATQESRDRHLFHIDPAVAWLWGFLDDIPAVVWNHEQSVTNGTSQLWDKQDAVRRLLVESVDRAVQEHRPVSPRLLTKMWRYQSMLLAAERRWLPELDPHLVHSAATCVSPTFARRLKEIALEYPCSRPATHGHVRVLTTIDGRRVLRIGDQYFVFASVQADIASGRRRLLHMPQLTSEERLAMDNATWVYRDWPYEQVLHHRLSAHARRLAHEEQVSVHVKPLTVGCGAAVDVRQTVRARIRGQSDVYVRFVKKAPRAARCDERCPIVWLINPHAVVTNTFEGFVPREAHSDAKWCYSAFYWLKGSRRLGDSPIRRSEVAYTVSLLRGVLPTALTSSPEAVADHVKSLPSHRRPMVPPWNDETLAAFRGSDLAIATAVRYAQGHAIVVMNRLCAVGDAVLQFARTRNVGLTFLSGEQFAPGALDRLGLDHNVPAPSQWVKPFDYVRRFMPEAETFE
jgi:hypothetical protein